MKKTKIITIILLFISFFILANISMAVTSEKTEKVTKEELTTITEMLNKVENNGFLKSIYSKPTEINLNMAFRQCGTEIRFRRFRRRRKKRFIRFIFIKYSCL